MRNEIKDVGGHEPGGTVVRGLYIKDCVSFGGTDPFILM